jgi:tetratricopeptide repeat protein
MSICVLLLLLAGSPQAIQQDPARTGWEAIQRGDGEKAASAFRQVLAANPRDARALTGAGMAAHLLGRDDDAVSSLKRAVQVDPEYAYAHFLLGQVAYSQGDLDLAIKSFERVVKIAPGDPGIYKQLEDWKKEAALHETFTARPAARFTVMFEGPAQQVIADRVSSMLDAAYGRVGRTLNTYPIEPVTAILYTQQQFRDITKSPAWAAAAYDGRIRIPVMGALTNAAELDRIVTHEFVHAVIHQTYPRIPFWLNDPARKARCGVQYGGRERGAARVCGKLRRRAGAGRASRRKLSRVPSVRQQRHVNRSGAAAVQHQRRGRGARVDPAIARVALTRYLTFHSWTPAETLGCITSSILNPDVVTGLNRTVL